MQNKLKFLSLRPGKLDWHFIGSILLDYLRGIARTTIILLIGIGLGKITTLRVYSVTDISLAIIIGTIIESALALVHLVTGSSFARRITAEGFLTVRGVIDELGHYHDQQPTNIRGLSLLVSPKHSTKNQQVILD
jgi:hypothetical protein